MDTPPRLSVVIPAYNEQERLPVTLSSWISHLSGFDGGWEIIVADDGSRDRTADVAESMARTEPRLRVVRLPANRGKGGAVREGVMAARGAVILFADADHNVAARFADRALSLIDGGVDVAIGERSLSAYASQERSVKRLFAGFAVQLTRRVLGLTNVRDTQCGFKAFRRSAAGEIFRRAQIDGFAFDIELLYLARRLKFRVQPFPVQTEYRAGSTFDVARHLPAFLRDLVRVRANALRGRYT